MTNKDKINLLFTYLDQLFPSPKCELIFHKDYELVIAVMLSAQSTDKAVNQVTAELFDKYPSLLDLANASLCDIENVIHPLGLYQRKAQNIKLIAEQLLNKYHGKVPSDKNELCLLPGVGNKTAGVIRMVGFSIPDFAVDTHILRIAKRLALVKSKATPLETEMMFKKLLNKDCWIKGHHQLIHFGRYHCTSQKPKCIECPLKNICHPIL